MLLMKLNEWELKDTTEQNMALPELQKYEHRSKNVAF